MQLTLFFVLSLIIVADCKPTKSPFECQTNSDCPSHQCCAKEPMVYLVSKRDLQQDAIRSRCEDYIQKGKTCAYYVPGNFGCGCSPGLKCKYFRELDTLNPWNRQKISADRKRMMSSEPDSVLCVKPNEGEDDD